MPSPQEFRQADVAEVVCDVTSSPVPVVAWYYNNMEITEDTESELPATKLNNTKAYGVLRASLHLKVYLVNYFPHRKF